MPCWVETITSGKAPRDRRPEERPLLYLNEIDQRTMTIPTSLGIHVFNFHCERLKIAAMARKTSHTGALMVLAKELPSTTMIPCEDGRLVLHNFQVYHQYMLYATYINACVGWMFDIRQGHIMSCHVSHVLSRYLQLYSVMLLLDSKV